MFDEALQAWWTAGPLHGCDSMLARLEEFAKEQRTDRFDVAKARALLLGYDARWVNEPYEVIRVQPMFRTAIVNPRTGRPSKVYELGGKLDVLVRDVRTREILIVETKTTSDKIERESSYWRTITALDPQVSTYFKGARKILSDVGLKEEAVRCVYDVVHKPKLLPLKATPPESQKFRQKDGELYSNMRKTDETPDEYEQRVSEDILGQPLGTVPLVIDEEKARDASMKYFARGDIVRLEQDEREHADDLWQTAQIIRDNELAKRAPRHRGSCKRYGGMCPYFSVCSGTARIEEFPIVEDKHEELKEI